MYINSMGHYVPATRISNDYFEKVNGLTSDWILQRTGIKSRSKPPMRTPIQWLLRL